MTSRLDDTFALRGWRATCALVSTSIAWLAAIGAIVGGLIVYAVDGVRPIELFRYFTILTNAVTAIGAGLLFPFAVEGFRRKYFSCPRWATLFYYSGTVCSTLTMLVATLFISQSDPVMAFGGYNFYLHIVCPLLTITTFFLVESDSHYTLRDSILAVLPVVVYAIVYLVEVVAIGSDRGGWDDMYQIAGLMPPLASLVLIVLVSFGLAQLIRLSYGRLSIYRWERLMRTYLSDDLSEAEVCLAILELGELVGRHEDENFVVLPLRGISVVAKKYGLRREELVEVYARALVDTMDERDKRNAAAEADKV